MRYMRFVRQIRAMLGGRIGPLSSLREEEALLRQFGALHLTTRLRHERRAPTGSVADEFTTTFGEQSWSRGGNAAGSSR
jgi:hypothetical protein